MSFWILKVQESLRDEASDFFVQEALSIEPLDIMKVQDFVKDEPLNFFKV
jgi:hypothetical protein